MRELLPDCNWERERERERGQAQKTTMRRTQKKRKKKKKEREKRWEMIIDWRVGGYINAETERTGTKCVSHAAVIRFYKAQLLLPL